MKRRAIAFLTLLALSLPAVGWGRIMPLRTPIRRFAPIPAGKLKPGFLKPEQRRALGSESFRESCRQKLEQAMARQKAAAQKMEGADASKMLKTGDVAKMLNDPKCPPETRRRVSEAYREMAKRMQQFGRQMRRGQKDNHR